MIYYLQKQVTQKQKSLFQNFFTKKEKEEKEEVNMKKCILIRKNLLLKSSLFLIR